MIKALWILISTLASNPLLAHGISDADKQKMIDGGYLQYVWLGASHMVTGYDHLLFLFGVVFFLTSFRDIAKFVSIFTVGHSITLVFATFYGISANYFFIDAVIALSVVYKGFDNNGGFQKYLNMTSPNLLKAVFAFGLIHGFGLSTRLQQLPLGDDGKSMLMRILSFNVGVELGQIGALLIMVSVLTFWREKKSDHFRKFSTIANNALILAGLMLFYLQTHGLLHNVSVDDLEFSQKEHGHVHEDMDIEKDKQEREEAHDNL
jgi:hypothetical protein